MCEKCVGILDEFSEMTGRRADDLHDLVMAETGRIAASRKDDEVDLSNVMSLTMLKILSELQSGQAVLMQAHANLMARFVGSQRDDVLKDMEDHFRMEGEEE